MGAAGGEIGTNLRAEAGLVELLLLVEEVSLLLFGELLVHALVLPLVEAAGEGAGPTAHGASGGQGGGEGLRAAEEEVEEGGRRHWELGF